MGILGTIGDVLGGAIELGSKVLKGAMEVAKTIAPIIAKIAPEILKLAPGPLAKIALGLVYIADQLGIFDSSDPIELGDRCIQATDAGITPDQFDSLDDYHEALMDFELDPELSAAISDNEKLIASVSYIASRLDGPLTSIFGMSVSEVVKAMISDSDYFTGELVFGELKDGSFETTLDDFRNS